VPLKKGRNGKVKWKPSEPRKQRFKVGEAKMKTLEDAGVPWYWLHNSWDSTLQVDPPPPAGCSSFGE